MNERALGICGAATQDADIGVVYLDRNPMKYDANHKPVLFDALPLNTANVGTSFNGKKGTLVGWGALEALSADIQTTIPAQNRYHLPN